MGKRFLSAIFLLLMAAPLSASATWQLANPSRGAAVAPPHTHVTGYPGRYASPVAITIKRGYLYENIRRIADAHGWKVAWYPRQRYPVFTPATFTGDTFVNTMSRLLSHYPLVVTYHTNPQNQLKIIVVRPVKSHHPRTSTCITPG